MVQAIFSISTVIGYSLSYCAAVLSECSFFHRLPRGRRVNPDALQLLWLKLASDQGMVASRLTLRSEA
jgi:hypothetical protein